MTVLVALPVVIPMIAGALALALWRSLFAQRVVGVGGAAALLAASLWLLLEVWREGVLVMHMGEWVAPYGIVFVADLLAAIMLAFAALTGFIVAVYSLSMVDEPEEHFGYYPLFHLLLAGVAGVFLTGDIFNLYVWIEVLLVASFALLTLGGERAQMEGAIKYVTLNLLSSILLLAGVGLTYGLFGSLNMADLADKFGQVEETGLLTTVGMLFLVAFAIKAAAFPFFFWLPASYHTPHVAVTALFAGLLTKLAVYVLFRLFSLMYDHDVEFTHHVVLMWIAGFTMLTGVLGAAAQFEFRRILSFHIVSQIGYMIMGLALYTPLALAGGIIFIVHNMVVKTNLLLISGVTYRLGGSYELKKLGGFYRSHPGLSILFLVSAMSLAGIPPLSGFIAKFVVIRAGVEVASWPIVVVALITGLLTLYSMVKIWAEVFWKAPPADAPERPQVGGSLWPVYTAIGIMAALAVLIGVAIEPLFVLAEAAAEQMLDADSYIEAVLGDRS